MQGRIVAVGVLGCAVDLQPYVPEAATVCAGGCNRVRWGLQPYVFEPPRGRRLSEGGRAAATWFGLGFGLGLGFRVKG